MSELFDIPESKSPRLLWIEKHGIATHYAEHMEEDPWMAIPMVAAKESLKEYITKDEPLDTIADMTASYGRLLEDWGMIGYGDTEADAIVDCAVKMGIKLWNEP